MATAITWAMSDAASPCTASARNFIRRRKSAVDTEDIAVRITVTDSA